jgi:asparaginyl-tRNA synthetase
MASLQVIAEATLPNYASEIQKLTTGSSVAVRGRLVESPAKGQKWEMRAEAVTVYCIAPSDYPLQKKNHTLEFLREIAHLRPRTNTLGAVARVRNSLIYAVHTFFQERGFVNVHTPIITGSDCEGAGEMLRVTTLDPQNLPRTDKGEVDYSKDLFGKRAGLTVSGQLEVECYAMALSKVYTFGPTFRAEKSNTTRHLCEFWMIEPEAAFFTLEDDMQLAESFVRYLARHVLEHNAEDLAFFNDRIDKGLIERLKLVADNEYARISYEEAIRILEKHNDSFTTKAHYGIDFQSEQHECFLAEKVFGKPVIVYNYPKEIKAFYMKLNDDERTVRAMDLLVPRLGEIIGGSEREDRPDVLLRRIREMGLDEKTYWWYLDLRKYGGAPHAGFGLGFERLIQFLTGVQNIRDVIPFPRFPGNAEF